MPLIIKFNKVQVRLLGLPILSAIDDLADENIFSGERLSVALKGGRPHSELGVGVWNLTRLPQLPRFSYFFVLPASAIDFLFRIGR